MKYRIRLLIILLSIGLVPLIIGGVYSARSVSAMGTSLFKESSNDIQTLMEQEVVLRVQGIAQQIVGYASLHPSVSLVDRISLRSNADLALLVVQPLGPQSFISIYNDETVILYHTDSELIGVNQFLGDTRLNPELWDIVYKSLTSQTVVSGYYETKVNADSRRMYMAAVRVRSNIPLIVSVTVDADAYLAAFGKKAQAMDRLARDKVLTIVVALGSIGVVILFVSIFLSGQMANPIQWMARTAYQLLRYVESTAENYRIPSFRDEISLINHTLGFLTKQFREQVSNLEEMVNNRTAELAQRTAQLETAAQIGRASCRERVCHCV